MLYNELTESLADTVTSSFFGNFVEVVIGKVEFVAGLNRISSETFPRSDGLRYLVLQYIRHQAAHILQQI